MSFSKIKKTLFLFITDRRSLPLLLYHKFFKNANKKFFAIEAALLQKHKIFVIIYIEDEKRDMSKKYRPHATTLEKT